MNYDFETLVSRKDTGAMKWDLMYRINPDAGDSVPLSVADMEFVNAPEIREGLKEYVEKTILGYTAPWDSYYEAVIGWMKRRHGYDVERDWIVTTSGVVCALTYGILAYTQPEDGVIIMPPVYHPFRMSVENSGRRLVENPLICTADGYRIDFEDLERKAAEPDVKLLIFCNPHNPVGRVWTKDEVEQVAKICHKHGVFVISDEIHQDLIMPGYTHISMGTLDRELLDNCLICTAPSKTFNTAGLATSNILIPDPERREAFVKARDKVKGGSGNMMGYRACEIAYTQCEEWLEQLLKKLDENRRVAEQFFAEQLPEAKVYRLEGTYLFWVDLNAYGIDPMELERRFRQEARVFLDEGYIFGSQGRGFERINIACPTWVLKDALERMKTVL